MQKQNTTSTTTAPTLAPTLAAMLAARAQEIAENERENARRELLSRESDREEALATAQTFIRAHISPALADALRMTPAVDDALIDAQRENDDQYNDHAGYVMLDMRGAGVDESQDESEEAQRDPDHDDRWILRYGYRHYYGYSWMLHGPQEYRASIGAPRSTDENLDRGLLDAIAAYPAWLAGADERAEEERRKRAERIQRIEEERPPHLADIEGPAGILARGAHLLIHVRDPRGDDGIIEWSATLEAHDDDWLLLTLDKNHAQRLVPIANVQDIHPLAMLAE